MLLKRPGLDKEDMKNYCPISNLPLISEHMEKVVARHIEHNDLNDSYQSAYSRGHSTETALLKVCSEIAEALDEGTMTSLIKLDLPQGSVLGPKSYCMYTKPVGEIIK